MKPTAQVLLCLLLSLPVYAQTPTNFADWTAKAAALLAAPGEGENEIRRTWDKGTKATEAGKAFLEAAKLAPDEVAKFKTLDSAGAAFAKGNGSNKEAVEAYRLARDITSAAPQERARVGLQAGKLSFEIADYEKVVAIEGASDKQKAQAYAEIAVKSSVAKDDARAAQSYELAARLDATQANYWLGLASVNAQRITPAKDAEAMLDRVYKAWIGWMENSDKSADEKAKARPYYLANWARDLQKVGANVRAIALWQEAANSPQALEQTRYDSLKNAATEAQRIKDYDGALVLWQKAGQVAPGSYLRAQEVALGRSNAQLGKGNYAQTRAELGVLLTHPQATATVKEDVLLTQAGLYFDEADALAKKGNAGAQVTTLEAAGLKILGDVWSVPTTSEGAMLQVVTRQVQREINKKDYATAHNEVKSGLEKFTARGFAREWLQQLYILNGDVYRVEKQYANAMGAYSAGILQTQWGATSLVPTQAVYGAAIEMLTNATDAKNFDEARKVVELLDKWRVPQDPTVLYKIELEIKSGNKEAARDLITKNKPLIFQEESKKKLAQLEAQANGA